MSADYSEYQNGAPLPSSEVVISRVRFEELRRLASIIEDSNDVIISKTIEGTINGWNGGAERIFGYTSREIVGEPISRLTIAGCEENLLRRLDTIRKAESVEHYEAMWCCKDGRKISVAVTTSPLRDFSGQIVGTIDISRDISGRKQAENTMCTAERLAAVARLASHIAHDINNPLSAVTNLLYLLENEDFSVEGKHYLAIAQQELSRITQISKQALGFYKDRGKPLSASIADILDDSLALRHSRCKSLGIEVLRDYRLPITVDCHPGDLRQIMVNLVDNALDAMPSGGRLHIRARTTTDWTTGVEGLRITVAYTRCGTSTEMRSQLFGAFDANHEATGMRLWACSHIANKYAGRITMRSSNALNRSGSVFTLFLPDAQRLGRTGTPSHRLAPAL